MSYLLSFSLVSLFLLLSQPTKASLISDWLQVPPYKNGGDVQEQLQCYALPYGVIGFISHILTYLTMFCLSRGRDPLFPWKMLRHKTFNIIISTIGLVITIVVTLLTIVRCRNGWQLVLIATWKLVFSLTLSFMAIHASCLINWPRMKQIRQGLRLDTSNIAQAMRDSQIDLRLEYDKFRISYRNILLWSIFLLLGALTGLTGIASLVKNNIATNHQLQQITYAFGGAAAGLSLVAFVVAYAVYPQERRMPGRFLGSLLFSATFFLALLIILFAFYSDWVLGVLAGDLMGVPSKDNLIFYVIYFAAKRLPMFST